MYSKYMSFQWTKVKGCIGLKCTTPTTFDVIFILMALEVELFGTIHVVGLEARTISAAINMADT
jgi:hypothetical protein